MSFAKSELDLITKILEEGEGHNENKMSKRIRGLQTC